MSKENRNKAFEFAKRNVAEWVPCCAVPFFALAIMAKETGDLIGMRREALAGVRQLNGSRPGRYWFVGIGQQMRLGL